MFPGVATSDEDANGTDDNNNAGETIADDESSNYGEGTLTKDTGVAANVNQRIIDAENPC